MGASRNFFPQRFSAAHAHLDARPKRVRTLASNTVYLSLLSAHRLSLIEHYSARRYIASCHASPDWSDLVVFTKSGGGGPSERPMVVVGRNPLWPRHNYLSIGSAALRCMPTFR